MFTPQDRWLFRVKRLRALRTWRRFNLDAILQATAFLLLLVFFWLLCFIGVSRLCTDLNSKDVIGPIILGRFLSFGFFAAMLVVGMGHVLTAYGSLFRGSELPLLVISPYDQRRIYRIQCIEALYRGGWGLALFCLPVLLAYGWTLSAPWYYYPIALIGMFGFWAIAGLYGVVMMLLISRWILGRPWRTLFGSMAVLGFGAFTVVYLAYTNSDLFVNVDPARLGERLANLRVSSSDYLPNQWMAGLLIAASKGDLYHVGLNLLLLIGGAFLFWQIAVELGDRWYQDAWLWAQERTRFSRPHEHRPFHPRGLRNIPLMPRASGSILLKELRLFSRDFSQWGQLVLIMALVLFYIANMQNFSYDTPETRQNTYYLVFFNMILLGFIQATLSLRFTFPCISLEGRSFWRVMSSGVGMPRFFFSKYYLHAFVLLIFGESMLYLLNSILNADATLWVISSIVLLLFSFGFTSWTMGLGAVFHKFDAVTAADVSSNTGALAAMILTMIYFGVSAALLATFAFRHTPGVSFSTLLAIEPNLITWVTLFLLWQTCAILLPVAYGLQKLEELEW